MGQKFLNFKLENFKKKSHSRGMKCQPKANNYREGVVVCARHVVRRPSKRMRAIYIYIYINTIETQIQCIYIYILARIRLLGRFTTCFAQTTTSSRLLFALG